MTAEFEIIISSEEPPPGGTNLTVRADQGMRMGRFSLAAVADAVAKLQALLQEPAPAPAALAQPGALLYQALFAGAVGEAWRDCLTLAAERKTPLRLRIYAESPALLAISWEYLYDESNQRWLALQPNLSLVRGLPLQQRPPQPVTGRLRVLVMIASPSDLPQLNSAQELANLTLATTTAAVELIVIAPTYVALQDALRRQPHVFHFVGHGFFEATAGATAQGSLLFCDAEGKAEPIDGNRLAPLLASCPSLGLVVLNACEGGVSGAYSPFAGLAQRLLQQGLPAVIAMQAPILDTDALRFSCEFYAALADGYGIEQAVGEGRRAIHGAAYTWGIPAFYLQGAEPLAVPQLSDAQKADRLCQQAQATLAPTAKRALLEQASQLAPDHPAVQAALLQLANAEKAAALYAEAADDLAAGAVHKAHQTLTVVERLAPNYRDTRTQLMELYSKLYPFPLPPPPTNDQAQPLLNALKEGRLIPFLGWDACRFGRLPEVGWLKGQALPDARELVYTLAEALGEQGKDVVSLAQISQYTALIEGEEALYERLHQLYADHYPPTLLHRLVAELPGRLRQRNFPTDPNRRFVVFSAAFDDLLERAFTEAGQPYHLFAYRPRYKEMDGPLRPERFIHWAPGAEGVEVTTPNTYTAHEQDPHRHPIIVKLCGQRVTAQPGSVMITEDHFLDYLPAQELGDLLPSTLLAQINRRSFVCLGYDVQPWHFRLLWRRMTHQKRRLAGKSWAIVPHPSDMAQHFWRDQEIEPLITTPELLVARVNQWLDTL